MTMTLLLLSLPLESAHTTLVVILTVWVAVVWRVCTQFLEEKDDG